MSQREVYTAGGRSDSRDQQQINQFRGIPFEPMRDAMHQQLRPHFRTHATSYRPLLTGGRHEHHHSRHHGPRVRRRAPHLTGACAHRDGVMSKWRVSIATRLRWFHLGARAVRPYLTIEPGAHPPPLYLCPECLTLFDEDSVANPKYPDAERLTIEDVPPEKLGGAPMLLTCKPCNNRAGTLLDSHAKRADL